MSSFLLPFIWNNVALIVFSLLAISIIFNKLTLKTYANQLILFPILFILLLIGMLYTTNQAYGWNIIERNLILLVAPIIGLSTTKLNTKQLNIFKNVFIISCLITSIYCLVYATLDFWQTGTAYNPGRSGHFIYNKFMYHQLVEPIAFHAIYYSFYLTIASCFALYGILFLHNSNRIKLLYWATVIISTCMIFLLKSSIFALIYPFNCLVLIALKYKKRVLSSTMLKFISLLILIFVGYLSFKAVQSKLETFKITTDYNQEFIGPLSIRIGIWNSTWQAIKEQPLLGTGTGDAKDVLTNYYKKQNLTEGFMNKYNAHNMYLQYWLSNGLLAITIFLLIIGHLFRMAIKYKNILFFLFIFTFFIFSLTEATMMRHKGIVFFVIISAFFSLNPKLWITK